VKVRGFRVELGEIEAQLLRIPGIREAVVVAREGAIQDSRGEGLEVEARTDNEGAEIERRDEPSGEKRLVAYLVYEETLAGAASADRVAELRAHLSTILPEYMVPTAFVRLEQLPLSATGKVDRRALPEPEAEAFAQRPYEAPVG
jgi:acyl-coenzyme A synthetase/AMP-(fatty) acid ligase